MTLTINKIRIAVVKAENGFRWWAVVKFGKKSLEIISADDGFHFIVEPPVA